MFHCDVCTCQFLGGIGVVALGSFKSEEDDVFVKRVERSWAGMCVSPGLLFPRNHLDSLNRYDVRKRETSMIMQSAFQVVYGSFLTGSNLNCDALCNLCCLTSLIFFDYWRSEQMRNVVQRDRGLRRQGPIRS
jgi:hypothetical protein